MIQSELLLQIEEIRTLLDAPTSLSEKAVASCRVAANHLADRCYFNAGWHMADPAREIKNSLWSAEAISADLAVMLDLLRSHQKPKRGRGRPLAPLDRAYIRAVILVRHLNAQNDYALKKQIVLSCLKEGWLKDRARRLNDERITTSTDAHIKKIDRELKKLAERSPAKTKNVQNFRPKKSRRQ